ALCRGLRCAFPASLSPPGAQGQWLARSRDALGADRRHPVLVGASLVAVPLLVLPGHDGRDPRIGLGSAARALVGRQQAGGRAGLRPDDASQHILRASLGGRDPGRSGRLLYHYQPDRRIRGTRAIPVARAAPDPLEWPALLFLLPLAF